MPVKLNPNQNPQIVPDVTPNGAGAMTPAMLAQIDAALTADAVIFYIASGGNDSNSGTAPGEPLATFDAAWDKLPSAYKQSCVIQCLDSGPFRVGDSGLYSNSGATGVRPINEQSVLQILGAPVSVVVPPSVAGAGSNPFMCVATGLVVTPGSLRGKILNDLDTGDRSFITGNVQVGPDTQINTLWGPFAIAPGSNFQVEEPVTTFICPSFSPPAFDHVNGFIGFRDIAWVSENIAGPFSFIPMAVFPENCFVTFDGCTFDLGTDNRFFYLPHQGHCNSQFNITNFSLNGPGLYMKAAPGTFGILQLLDKSTLLGHVMVDNIQLTGTVLCEVFLAAIDAKDDSGQAFVEADTQSYMQLGQGNLNAVPVIIGENTYADLGQNAPLSGVPLSFQNMTTQIACFQAEGRSYAKVGTLTGAFADGNTVYGLAVTDDSNILINQFGGSTTVSGGPGDTLQTLVGATPTDYSGLPFIEPNTFNKIG